MSASACPPGRVSILIAVAVRLYRDGLAMTLSSVDRLHVAGTAETSLEALAAARTLRPEVALIDSTLDDVFDLMRALRSECPETRILVFAVREDIASILSYADAGAEGFVTATGTMTELLSAIESARIGELTCSPRIAAQLLRQAARRSDCASDPATASLTVREREVLSLLQQGRSNKEIAANLCIAEATVKNHVHHLLEKLQVATRAKAAAAALRSARWSSGQQPGSPRTGF